jgi:hypothetical protein
VVSLTTVDTSHRFNHYDERCRLDDPISCTKRCSMFPEVYDGLVYLPVYFGVSALEPSTTRDRNQEGPSLGIRTEATLPWPLILPKSA